MGEQLFLDLDQPPEYITSDLRFFSPGEKHVVRMVGYDVLVVVLSGALVFYEEGKRICVKKGQWYIQRAGLFQEGIEPSIVPVYYYLHFYGKYTGGTEKSLPLSGSVDPSEVQLHLEKLSRMERSRGGSLIDCLAPFYTVLSKLYERSKAADGVYSVVKQIEEYIAENYTEEITIQRLSQVFQYSGDHIIRIFRTTLGVTPHQYLLQLRFDQVCRLLLSTDNTLDRIAEETGYTDVSTLYRTFIRKTGVSPREWKNRQISKEKERPT